jgi:predicted phage tail protein
MLTPVILSGFLAKRFGKRFTLDVETPREAVQALCIQLKGFEQALLEYKPGFRVWLDRELQPDADFLDRKATGDAIRIVPVIAGAKDSTTSIIVGTILIIATDGVYGWEWLGNIGYAMVISGVGQLLAGAPPKPDMNARPDNKPNFVYDGPVNTTAQGNPVPICYGTMEIGSQVLSASIISEQVVSDAAVNDPVHHAL